MLYKLNLEIQILILRLEMYYLNVCLILFEISVNPCSFKENPISSACCRIITLKFTSCKYNIANGYSLGEEYKNLLYVQLHWDHLVV